VVMLKIKPFDSGAQSGNNLLFSNQPQSLRDCGIPFCHRRIWIHIDTQVFLNVLLFFYSIEQAFILYIDSSKPFW
jgi:hypothetical protein